MKFCWSTIAVKDMAESLRFYQEIIGLKLERELNGWPNTEIAFLTDERGISIELIFNKDHREINIGKDISIGFQVESLDTTLSFIKEKGIPIYSGPFQPNPRVRFFYILDPNGLKIQFVERDY